MKLKAEQTDASLQFLLRVLCLQEVFLHLGCEAVLFTNVGGFSLLPFEPIATSSAPPSFVLVVVTDPGEPHRVQVRPWQSHTETDDVTSQIKRLTVRRSRCDSAPQGEEL